tara:strand:- start:2990 stop:3673 length:684 start_codon:yes stop_codon:yes gene_type:complete
MNLKDKKVLVIVAHQDDETIGCGATLRKWNLQGAEIHVCFMTNGNTGVQQGTDGQNIVKTRMKEAMQAAIFIGATNLHNLGLDCQKVVNTKKVFHQVIKKIREIKPYIIITHDQICKHRDHKRTSLIVEEAAWKANEDILQELGPIHRTQHVWSCEILDPLPQVDFCVDVSDTWDDKLLAMDKYFSQLGILNDIENYLDGISKVRGYSIGTSRAEAFRRLGKVPIKL